MGENSAVNRKILLPLAALFLAVSVGNVSAQGTTFFYQGRLSDNGSAASGVYELRFALFDAVTTTPKFVCGTLMALPLMTASKSAKRNSYTPDAAVPLSLKRPW